MKKIKIIGFLMTIVFIILTLMWYDWKLLLIIFLALFAENIDKRI